MIGSVISSLTEKILHKIKLNKTETLELNEYVEEIKKINEEFINEIKLL
jgi:hypothetical protein